MSARRSCRRSLALHALCCGATAALLLLLVVTSTAHAEYVGAGAPSGASCRVFVLASDAQTRFALVESYADQDGVDVYDDFPVVTPGIRATPLEDVYETLRPSFLAIQTFLLARARPLQLEPRHCHAHVIATGAATRALAAPRDLDALFARVHQDSIEDAQFPFLLARDDLGALSAAREFFYLVAGANFLDGRVPAALTPGDDALVGLFTYSNDSAAMAFDSLERWRRSKRSKLKHTPLDTGDLFSREYAGYGAAALRAAVDKQLALTGGDDTQSHVCTPSHDSAGDAAKCVRAVHAVVRAGNAACPEGSYCALGGVAQPQPPLGAFYAGGLFRTAVTFVSRVLQQRRDGGDVYAPVLALPTPTLAAIRAAADYVCALPLATLLDAQIVYAPQRSAEHACLDLCATVVLLQTFGVADADARVRFAGPSVAAAEGRAGGGGAWGTAAAEELRAWLTGAFLHLEALQQRRAFAVEAELLAVQVDAGVPIGFHLSALLLGLALAFLYATSGGSGGGQAGRASASTRRSSYQRVVNGSGKAKQPPHSTQAILFIDDASE